MTFYIVTLTFYSVGRLVAMVIVLMASLAASTKAAASLAPYAAPMEPVAMQAVSAVDSNVVVLVPTAVVTSAVRASVVLRIHAVHLGTCAVEMDSKL